MRAGRRAGRRRGRSGVEECDGSAIFFVCVFVCLCVGSEEGGQQRSSQLDAAMLLNAGGASRSPLECGVVGAMAPGRVVQPAADLGVLSAHRECLLTQQGDVLSLQSGGKRMESVEQEITFRLRVAVGGHEFERRGGLASHDSMRLHDERRVEGA